MIPVVQIVAVAATFAHTVSAYSSYLELIPNGSGIGKTLGHTDTDHTEFGTLFADENQDWATVCPMTWPGGSVTCGEALGDPCCTWTSGDPDFVLTEVSTNGTVCADGPTSPDVGTKGDPYQETPVEDAGDDDPVVDPATKGGSPLDPSVLEAGPGNTPYQQDIPDEVPVQTGSAEMSDPSEYCE